MEWLAGIWEMILAIPKILEAIQALFRFVRDVQHQNDLSKNEEARKELENVQNPEDAQKAADSVAGRFGS